MRRRYGLYLRAMADRLELTTSTRHVSKFQILEKSIEFYLNPVTERVAMDGLAIEVKSAKEPMAVWRGTSPRWRSSLLCRSAIS
jgi:hypothetical protein